MVVDGVGGGPVKGVGDFWTGEVMGLDVGVVSINYLPVPGFPVSNFMRELVSGPIHDEDDDECECWGGGWAYNSVYEFSRDCLEKQVNTWADRRGISSGDRATLLSWIGSLPYQGDSIILHMSV